MSVQVQLSHGLSFMLLLLIALPVWFSTPVAAQTPSIQVQRAVGPGVKDLYSAIRRSLATANLEKRKGFKRFEFLPVTVETAGMSIAAVIRLGIHCGVEIVSDTPNLALLNAVDLKAGIEVAVFAHLAGSVTNDTYGPDEEKCKLKVIQEYNLALGAIAGASVEVDIPRNSP